MVDLQLIIVRFVALWLAVFSAGCFAQAPVKAGRSGSDIVNGIDKAAYARENDLSGYTVQEKYDLFRHGDESPAAEIIVETTYVHSRGKTYKTISEAGSASGKLVLHKILQDEQQLSQRADRTDILITSRNYIMSLQGLGERELNGRECLVVSIKPKRTSPYLLDGTIWVDAANYHLVRVEGRPSADPSVLTG